MVLHACTHGTGFAHQPDEPFKTANRVLLLFYPSNSSGFLSKLKLEVWSACPALSGLLSHCALATLICQVSYHLGAFAYLWREKAFNSNILKFHSDHRSCSSATTSPAFAIHSWLPLIALCALAFSLIAFKTYPELHKLH